MGVGVSDWHLARAVSQTGQLGVVSGTGLDILCTRRLQRGDPEGDVRRALAAFPRADMAQWILDAYFVEGGIAPDQMFRQVPRHTLDTAQRLTELTVVGAFVEVFLAKEGHEGIVGINFLRKIELPLPPALYGAMLAGVDAVLVGAGSPSEIPAMVRGLARHEAVTMSVKVLGARSSDAVGDVAFDPNTILPQAVPGMSAPPVLAIVASTDLATGLAADPHTRPDGFIIEGPTAGGHNAPPRGPRRIDEHGQPVYDDRDVVDLPAVLALGLPVWLAGGYGTADQVRSARAQGAMGVQVGTAFAYCIESGFEQGIKDKVHAAVLAGDLQVRSDWRASPTGFPFQVAQLDGTLSEPAVRASRKVVCDLGVLRTAYMKADGVVDYRCPAEPLSQYVRKGGRDVNVEGRVCLCNALFASAGFPQRRPGGAVEPALVSAGGDLTPVRELLQLNGNRKGYRAADVVAYLLGTSADLLG
jgi:NAD(P)H-dependent flavin oxidoreductase YrpB (nitropropane dioxygenase family)